MENQIPDFPEFLASVRRRRAELADAGTPTAFAVNTYGEIREKETARCPLEFLADGSAHDWRVAAEKLGMTEGELTSQILRAADSRDPSHYTDAGATAVRRLQLMTAVGLN